MNFNANSCVYHNIHCDIQLSELGKLRFMCVICAHAFISLPLRHVHGGVFTCPLYCNNQVINCRIAAVTASVIDWLQLHTSFVSASKGEVCGWRVDGW